MVVERTDLEIVQSNMEAVVKSYFCNIRDYTDNKE